MAKVGDMLLKALKSKYQADMDDAQARLAVYLNNPVGIGEHPQHTEEMDKIVEQYVNASDKMKALDKMIDDEWKSVK